MASPPLKIGKYEVLNVIGRGGMGVVYKARDPQLDRLVAIKMIIGATPGLLKRFNVEARSMASLQHQNIVTIYDFGDQDGSPYLVMEYLEGMSLDSILSSGRSLTLVSKLNICIDVCNGLNYAHERDIIHRDIKPANVMVLNDGSVKIVDFGIARIGDTGISRTEVVGSLHYMSPEQFQSQPLDRRTDIFSTGVVLYQLLAGVLPFQSQGEAAVIYQILHDDPPPLASYVQSYPPELDTIISKALAKNRDMRYPTGRDLAFDLLAVLEKEKHLEVTQWQKRAETAVAREEWTRAEECLRQVLKVDQHHTQAHQLLTQVQARIRQQRHLEQVRQLRLQADDAFLNRRYDEALGIVEQAILLDSTNQDLARLRESIQEAKTRAAHVKLVLLRAEEAQHAGDLEEAKQAVQEALEIDPNETSAKALQVVILKQAEEQQRQLRLRRLFDSVRDQIAVRDLTGALKTLQEAETIDSTSVELYSLRKVVNAAREEQSRKLEIEKLTRGIEQALNREDYATATAIADQGLQRYPREEGLLRLKTLAETQQRRVQLKAYARDQFLAANELLEAGKSSEALSAIENALRSVPGDAQLEKLRDVVKDRLTAEEAEERKRHLLGRAAEMVAAEQFDDAVRLLEKTRRDFVGAQDVEALLERTRSAWKHAEIVSKALSEARQLLNQGSAEQAVQFLENKTLELADARLSALLETARRQREHFQVAVQSAIEQGNRILREGGASAARRYLDAQPAQYREVPEYNSLFEAVASRLACETLDQEFARNPEPDAQVRLAEAALRQNPGNEDIKKRLATVRDRKAQIGAIVEKARALESSRRYSDAADELRGIRELHPRYPSLESEIKRLEHLEKQRLLERVARHQQEEFQLRLQLAIDEGNRILQGQGASEAAKYLAEQAPKYAESPEYRSFAEMVARRVPWEALDRELAGNTDADVQVRLAEAALRKNPANEEIKKRLASVRDRKEQITAIAKRSRSLEAARQYRRAAEELQRMRQVHPDYPGLESEIQRLERLGEQSQQALRNKLDEAADLRAAVPLDERSESGVGATVIMGRSPVQEERSDSENAFSIADRGNTLPDALSHATSEPEPISLLRYFPWLSKKQLLVAAVVLVGALGLLVVYRIVKNPTGPPTIMVSINVSPADSAISVDGHACPAPCRLPLSFGQHVVEADHDGYYKLTQQIDVSRGRSSKFPFDLLRIPPPPPNAGTVLLEANVEGANVVIDGQVSGQIKGNRFSASLAPGKHKIRVQKPGFEPQEEEIDVAENRSLTVPFKLRESVGSHAETQQHLVIEGPAGAQFAIDGQRYELPASGKFDVLVPAGTRHLEMNAKGFYPWTRDVTVTAASPSHVVAEMKVMPTPKPPSPSPSGKFQLSRTVIERGEKAELSWNIENASSVTLDGAAVNPSGFKTVAPADSYTYHLVAIGPGGEHDFDAAIVVNIPSTKPKQDSSVSEQDKSDIRDLFQKYSLSYEHKDAKAVQDLWPGIPKEKLKVIKESYKLNTKVTFSDFQYILDPDGRVRVLCTQTTSNQLKSPSTKPNFTVLVNRKAGHWVIDFVPMNDNP